MIIYITTNILTGEKYIGKDEKNNPSYTGSGLHLRRAIKKYGKENFIKETLCEGIDRKDLEELEMYYIDYYSAQKSKLFYNIAPGGTGGKITQIHPTEKKVYQYDLEGNFIKEWKNAREAYKELNIDFKKISSCCNNKRKQTHGFMWSFKKESKQQYKRLRSKPIIQYDLNNNVINQWRNINEALKFFNKIGSTCISACLNNRQNTALGFKWEYRYN